jgi:drug/metabolite transporter (DMT)-like permease
VLGRSMGARRHWRHFLMLGLFNSALPFLLYAYSARTVPASLLSVLNATAPIWAALIAAALAAAFSYGIATNYAKSAAAVEPFANAYGSMWAATLLLLPLMFATPLPSEPPDPHVVASAVALGVLCSGVAYLLYFRLVADIGPAPALTVTFLVPVFGILWGVLLLGETVGWHTFVGSASVLIGTALATGFSPRAVFADVGRKR